MSLIRSANGALLNLLMFGSLARYNPNTTARVNTPRRQKTSTRARGIRIGSHPGTAPPLFASVDLYRRLDLDMINLIYTSKFGSRLKVNSRRSSRNTLLATCQYTSTRREEFAPIRLLLNPPFHNMSHFLSSSIPTCSRTILDFSFLWLTIARNLQRPDPIPENGAVVYSF